MEEKYGPVEVREESSTPTEEVERKWQGTDADRHAMRIIGRPQQLRRNFHNVSILGLGCVLICTWEINVTTLGITLLNGGTAGLIYGFIIASVGYSFVYASLAELASISPTAGGQYHWISEFSPAFCQKYLSYISGWLCFTGWQASISSIAFLAGSSIQALIVLHQPESYIPKAWHGTLIVIAIVFFAFLFNTTLSSRLPFVQALVFAVHIFGVIVIFATLWALSPRKSAHEVFTEFTNGGGWSSMGVSFMVGLLPTSGSLAGIDCVAHMAEEVKDSSRTLPITIMTAMPLNAIVGFLMIVTLCFGTYDMESILASPVGMTGYPFVQIFQNATGNLGATTVLVLIPVLSLTGSVIAEVATASRQLWSFARDGGVPFSSYLARVNPRSAIPFNAILVSLVVNCLLPLINIGSTAALNAVFSLAGVSLLTSYILCIGSVLYKRITGERLPSRRWSLGRSGAIVNAIALCFLLPLAIFQFFPPVVPVTPVSMNWGCLMYGSMIIFATAYYAIYGRKVYVPPVVRVKRDL